MCELWLDGSWTSKPAAWHLDEVYDTVRRLQPDCQITSNWTIGDAHGKQVTPDKLRAGMDIKYWPSDFRISDPYAGHARPQALQPRRQAVLHAVRGDGHAERQRHLVLPPRHRRKPVDALEAIFETATAQDNCLVFNLPPRRASWSPTSARR